MSCWRSAASDRCASLLVMPRSTASSSSGRLDSPPPSLAESCRSSRDGDERRSCARCRSVVLRGHVRRTTPAQAITWDCGYARPTSTMAYGLVRGHPRVAPRLVAEVALRECGVERAVPSAASFHSSVPEPILETVLTPLWAAIWRTASAACVPARAPPAVSPVRLADALHPARVVVPGGRLLREVLPMVSGGKVGVARR